MARIDAMTMKMDAQYKEIQSRSNHSTPDCNDDDIPMSREEDAKFIQNNYNRDYYRPNSEEKPNLQKQLSDSIKDQHSTNAFFKETFMDLKTKLETTIKNTQASILHLEAKFDRIADKQFARPFVSLPSNTQPIPKDFVILEIEEDSKVPLILGRPFIHTADAVIHVKQKQLNLGVGSERMIIHIDSAMKHSYSNEDTCFNIDIINEILEEYFDALLDEESSILYSIEGTPLEEKLFVEFEFMAMTVEEEIKSKPPEEEIPFK
nr:reverse transcriptase domain-containing protein [Tanacetum cinerariifolium]